MGWKPRCERVHGASAPSRAACDPLCSDARVAPVPRVSTTSKTRSVADSSEIASTVGPCTETREEHLTRHEGGRRTCPRCRHYMFGDSWTATYGSFPGQGRDREVWLAERPARWGGSWGVGDGSPKNLPWAVLRPGHDQGIRGTPSRSRRGSAYCSRSQQRQMEIPEGCERAVRHLQKARSCDFSAGGTSRGLVGCPQRLCEEVLSDWRYFDVRLAGAGVRLARAGVRLSRAVDSVVRPCRWLRCW